MLFFEHKLLRFMLYVLVILKKYCIKYIPNLQPNPMLVKSSHTFFFKNFH